MSTGLILGEYATTPLYNIKAVVQATNISPSTLRAWERRYDVARPQRSESGYRLYSERDIAIIRWLKSQVDAGMSISQAVSWLGTIADDAGGMERAVLPITGSGAPLHDGVSLATNLAHEAMLDFPTLQNELLRALVQFDEEAAEVAISEAFALYPVEQVGDRLFLPVLMTIHERQQRGEISLTAEYFAGTYLIQRLGTLLRAVPNGVGTPLLWVGSAHTALPEASALLLSIYLRRAGYHVHYLGDNLPVAEEAVSDLAHEARRHQPAMLLFCASTTLAAEGVGQLLAHLAETMHLPAIIGYSGAVYARNPDLRAHTAGVYLGAQAHEVVRNINQLLAERHRGDRKYDKKGRKSRTLTDRIAATK